VTPHCYTSISGLSEYYTGHVLRISCLGCRRLACAAGGSINCKAQKQTLADARRGRHEARQREQQEFDRAESDLAGFALILSDQANPPCRIVETRRLFDWSRVRRAVAETQFWDACCRRAEAVLASCLKDLKQRRRKRQVLLLSHEPVMLTTAAARFVFIPRLVSFGLTCGRYADDLPLMQTASKRLPLQR
jgi:hypothetical protein